MGQISTAPIKPKFSINLLGHVADFVGFLNRDPLLIWTTAWLKSIKGYGHYKCSAIARKHTAKSVYSASSYTILMLKLR